jgi:hypothetical protein
VAQSRRNLPKNLNTTAVLASRKFGPGCRASVLAHPDERLCQHVAMACTASIIRSMLWLSSWRSGGHNRFRRPVHYFFAFSPSSTRRRMACDRFN